MQIQYQVWAAKVKRSARPQWQQRGSDQCRMLVCKSRENAVPLRDVNDLFIDVAYLEERLRKLTQAWFRAEGYLNYSALGSSFDKVFYYHALPAQRKDEPETAYITRRDEREAFFNRL